jgi:Na+-translocating ferredoxin:NAD+ oxidoreductase RnfG subunit
MVIMKLNIITFFILTLTAFNSRSNDFYPKEKAISHIKKSLKTQQVDLIQEIEVADEFLSENAIVIYSFKQDNNTEINYAIFREAKGKHDKFDYLVISNSDQIVTNVRIIKYRSEHGGEITSKKWLRQFTGYSKGKLKYKTDISAISGATVSANSITNDIPQVIDILRKTIE